MTRHEQKADSCRKAIRRWFLKEKLVNPNVDPVLQIITEHFPEPVEKVCGCIAKPTDIQTLRQERDTLRAELNLLGETNQHADKLANKRGVELMEIRAELLKAKEEVAELKERNITLEFSNKTLTHQHADHESDYLSVWKLIKRPNESVVDAAKRLVNALNEIATFDEQPIWNDDRDDAADNMLNIARDAIAAKDGK